MGTGQDLIKAVVGISIMFVILVSGGSYIPPNAAPLVWGSAGISGIVGIFNLLRFGNIF